MIARLIAALRARQAARREAEALVYNFGSRGVAMARGFAADPAVSEDRRAHYRRVARIAEQRHETLASLDTATRYEVLERWQRRCGAKLGQGQPFA